MFTHVCQLIIYLLRKISKLRLIYMTKDILFCFRLLYPLKTCHQVHLEKQFGADIACTFIECCLLMSRVIQFHASFPSRTE